VLESVFCSWMLLNAAAHTEIPTSRKTPKHAAILYFCFKVKNIAPVSSPSSCSDDGISTTPRKPGGLSGNISPSELVPEPEPSPNFVRSDFRDLSGVDGAALTSLLRIADTDRRNFENLPEWTDASPTLCVLKPEVVRSDSPDLSGVDGVALKSLPLEAEESNREIIPVCPSAADGVVLSSLLIGDEERIREILPEWIVASFTLSVGIGNSVEVVGEDLRECCRGGGGADFAGW
jgi:hypothetical protein